MKKNNYHYTLCGLDYVYLNGGFETIDTEYGPATSVFHSDDLHRAIGLQVVECVDNLTHQEFRFFRHEMLLSQADTAKVMGVSESTYRNWENGRTSIPGPSCRFMKVLYLQFIDEASKIKKFIIDLAETRRQINRLEGMNFALEDKDWSVLEDCA